MEDPSDQELALTPNRQRTPALPRFCQFLPPVHPTLQSPHSLSHRSTLEEAQGSILEPRSRHWLEGVQHPLTVITDHWNLVYLQNAKRLKAFQARWALFFARFHFTITSRPGSKNIKADTLSWVHQPDSPSTPEPVLSPAVIVTPGAVQIIECDYHAHLLSKAALWLVVNLHHLLLDGAAFNTQSRSSLTS